MNRRARARSVGRCAQYVRFAIEAGGITLLAKHRSAKDAGGSLLTAGFLALEGVPEGAVEEEPVLQVGDVVVVQSVPRHPHGHMAMYNGSIWVSDFRQLHGLYPGPGYRGAKPLYTIYRYPA